MRQSWPRLDRHQPVVYRIRIQGDLDEDWADYLSVRSLSVLGREPGTPVTTLITEPVDQAGMIGTINYLAGVGALLLSVEYLPEPGSEKGGCGDSTTC